MADLRRSSGGSSWTPSVDCFEALGSCGVAPKNEQCAAFTPQQVNEVPLLVSIFVSGTLLRSAGAIGSRGRNGADRDCTSPR